MRHHEVSAASSVTVHIVKAFAVNGAGGNPAGVVLDSDGLDERQMQSVATHAGLSETVFVSRSETAGARLDFFTPSRRIAHCGHATVAAFALMRAEERIRDGASSKQTIDGSRRIFVQGGMAFMQQRAPQFEDEADWIGSGVARSDVLCALGLTEEDVDPAVELQVVDTGNRFLLVGLTGAAALGCISPDLDAITQISETLDLVGFYIFARDGVPDGFDATTRMFAPRFGIAEESATGMAAGPLACLLNDVFDHDRTRFVIEQGRFMPEPSISRIQVDLNLIDGRIVDLMAGGEAHPVGRMHIELSSEFFAS